LITTLRGTVTKVATPKRAMMMGKIARNQRKANAPAATLTLLTFQGRADERALTIPESQGMVLLS
jgi:hypothetical protein